MLGYSLGSLAGLMNWFEAYLVSLCLAYRFFPACTTHLAPYLLVCTCGIIGGLRIRPVGLILFHKGLDSPATSFTFCYQLDIVPVIQNNHQTSQTRHPVGLANIKCERVLRITHTKLLAQVYRYKNEGTQTSPIQHKKYLVHRTSTTICNHLDVTLLRLQENIKLATIKFNSPQKK